MKAVPFLTKAIGRNEVGFMISKPGKRLQRAARLFRLARSRKLKDKGPTSIYKEKSS